MRDPHCIHCNKLVTPFNKGWKYSVIKIKGRYCHESCYDIYMSPENKKIRHREASRIWKYAHGVKPRPPRLSKYELIQRRHSRYLKNRHIKLSKDRERWKNRTPEQKHRTRVLARIAYHKRRDKVRETDYQFKVKIL